MLEQHKVRKVHVTIHNALRLTGLSEHKVTKRTIRKFTLYVNFKFQMT